MGDTPREAAAPHPGDGGASPPPHAVTAAHTDVSPPPTASALDGAAPAPRRATGGAQRAVLAPPRLLANGLEVSVHGMPRAFVRELALVLPGVPLEGVLLVPTCQRAAMDLVNTGPDVAAEKDALLERVRACGVVGWVGVWWVEGDAGRAG